MIRWIFSLILLQTSIVFAEEGVDKIIPKEIVREAVNHWRDSTSRADAEMVIHRPSWERRLSFISITKGNEKSLVRFTAPPKDAGNATLSLGDDTWTFAPKVNRVIKIPPSMKAQSWMGSDFSYRDLSRSDEIIDQYTHKLLEVLSDDGHKVYRIESIPFETAAVVWGKEVIDIRDDHIILRHKFFDQDGKLVKELVAKEITIMDGKVFPKVIRVSKIEEPDEWTEIDHHSMKFKQEVPDSTFTLSSLSTY